jgi:hypothetical protein
MRSAAGTVLSAVVAMFLLLPVLDYWRPYLGLWNVGLAAVLGLWVGRLTRMVCR